jgi:membrane protease YdiL (CAAX protease family)
VTKQEDFQPFLSGGPLRRVMLGAITLAALVLTWNVQARSLGWAYQFPQMSLQQPVRALFLVAERSRRVTQAHAAWWRFGEAEFSSETAVANAFDELSEERGRYRGLGYRKKGGAGWIAEADAARVIALAGWGRNSCIADVKALDQGALPEYLEPRAREITSGDVLREQARVQAAVGLGFGWWARSLLSLVAVGLVSLWKLASWHYPRRPARCQLKAPPFWQGLVIFAWAYGFRSALVLLRSDDPDGVLGWLNHVPSLVPALTATLLLVGTRGQRAERPVTNLVACPPDRRSKRGVVLLALAATGGIFIFCRVAFVSLHHLGLGPSWPEAIHQRTTLGSSAEAVASFISMTVFAPIAEELLFRGVLFGALVQKMSTHRAALVSCVLFALVHGYGLFGSAQIMLTGYIWARLDARTGTLAPSLVAHSLTNFVLGFSSLLAR